MVAKKKTKDTPSNNNNGSKSKDNEETRSSSIQEREYKILHPVETPRSHHKPRVKKPGKGSQPVSRSGKMTESERLVVSDPYEYRLSQSQRDKQSVEAALQLQDRARIKANLSVLVNETNACFLDFH